MNHTRTRQTSVRSQEDTDTTRKLTNNVSIIITESVSNSNCTHADIIWLAAKKSTKMSFLTNQLSFASFTAITTSASHHDMTHKTVHMIRCVLTAQHIMSSVANVCVCVCVCELNRVSMYAQGSALRFIVRKCLHFTISNR